MTDPPVPLTALSEDQRAQAHSRFPIIRPARGAMASPRLKASTYPHYHCQHHRAVGQTVS